MSPIAKPALLLVVALGTGLASFFAVPELLTQNRHESGKLSDISLTSSGNDQSQDDVISIGRPSTLKRDENKAVEFWPPVTGNRYPELVLRDSNGAPVRLSDHAGKVILLELVAVPCKGCQAFAGGNKYGGFAGVGVQPDLDSIHEYAERFAGINLTTNPDVLFVQLLLYGKGMGRPTQEETMGWAKHFRMNVNDHQIVLRGDASMVNRNSYSMIPGFHLIDRDFVLRSDSCGHRPNENLYTELLPKLKELTQEPRRIVSGKQQGNPFFAE